MNDKQREELRTLAAGLLRVPAEQFDMGTWAVEEHTPESEIVAGPIGWAPRLIPDCGITVGSDHLELNLIPYFNDKPG
jgi:hypothetical protein